MARVPYVDKAALPEAEQKLLLSDTHISLALGNSPGASHQSGLMARYIGGGTRPAPRLRELAIIQVGYSMGSAYEYAHHVEVGLRVGCSDADILAIAEETAGRRSGLEPLARTVLLAAREMSDGIAISDATFAALKAELDNATLVELILAIANYTGVVRMLASLQVDLEEHYLPLLDRFPLRKAAR